MGPEFFQTHMGRKFYEADVPRIAKSLESIAASLEKLANPVQEVELPAPDSLSDLASEFKSQAMSQDEKREFVIRVFVKADSIYSDFNDGDITADEAFEKIKEILK